MFMRSRSDLPPEEVKMSGVEGTTIQWLLSAREGAPNFTMRRFVIEPGGHIDLHGHPWEHEIYFISGRGKAFVPGIEVDVKEGDAVLIPADEPHGYSNTSDEDLVFLCMVPNIADTR